MYYGYNKSVPFWNGTKRDELATRLRELRESYEYEQNGHPTLTNDERGVLMRMVGRLPEDQQAELIKKADEIFLAVMMS